MAIQIPNPGTGNGATGDNEFVLWSKVKDNFSDQTHAASKLAGESSGNVMQVGAFGLGLNTTITPESTKIETLPTGFFSYADSSVNIPTGMSIYSTSCINIRRRGFVNDGAALFFPYRYNPSGNIVLRVYGDNSVYVDYVIRSDKNTTKDANGFLKVASPIVKVFADKLELNDDAADQDVTYKKNGVGDYTITTVSGLSTDGWYIELPKDMNGNPKVAVTLTEVDGVISLKTYKRIFSMETFTFEPDLDNPLDIPDTRWIDLRLNEIHVEPSELETEV